MDGGLWGYRWEVDRLKEEASSPLLLNRELIWSLLLFVLLSNAIFQWSIHDSILQAFWKATEGKDIVLSKSTVSGIVIFFQTFSVAMVLINILILGLILWLVSFLLGGTAEKKTFLKVVLYAYVLTSIRLLILAVLNFAEGRGSSIIIANPDNLWINILDPFLWLSAVLVYLVSKKLVGLSNMRTLVIASVYVLFQLSSLFLPHVDTVISL